MVAAAGCLGVLSGMGLLMGVALWKMAPRAPVLRPTVKPPASYAVRGVDVSRYQGRIDWESVAASGEVSFAFVKATEGTSHKDRRFQRNWDGAHAAGIPVGAYHYFSLCRTGKSQAEHFIRVVPKRAGSLPPVVDIEPDSRCNRGSRLEKVGTEVAVWIADVEAHYGQRPLVYTSAHFHRHHLAEHQLKGDLWAAAYSRAPRTGGAGWAFWQYSDRGWVTGIPGPVDLNVFHGTKAQLEAIRRPSSDGS